MARKSFPSPEEVRHLTTLAHELEKLLGVGTVGTWPGERSLVLSVAQAERTLALIRGDAQ